jgi:2,3-bisphosphoglycerate-dependent phosphoglycerate mutase
MVAIPVYYVTFLRHGESVGNVEDRFQGQADFPLTEKGLAQARALAARWKEAGIQFNRCISSPLLRARQTAEIVTAALQVPLEFDQEWMEINNGLIAGLTADEAVKIAPKPTVSTPYTRYGQTGESRWEVYLRAGRAVQRILDGPPGHILVTAHGGILNMALYAILGITVQADGNGPRFYFANTTFASFTYEPDRHCWRMISFGDRQHWKDE